MTEKRELTCIGCPMGCSLLVEMREGKIKQITGYTCKRGKSYAEKEVTNPTRIVTSTVRVKGGIRPVVSVKTSTDIPKNRIFDCMEEIRNVRTEAPVISGEILLKNVCGTGADLVATASCAKRQS